MELGCGTGDLLNALKPKRGVGIDFSQEMVRIARKRYPNITIIVMSAYGTIERAVEAIKAGAYDFIQKPIDTARMIHMLKKTCL